MAAVAVEPQIQLQEQSVLLIQAAEAAADLSPIQRSFTEKMADLEL
jgi:leucyl aminopeptidase (aminopeptidase T)